MGTTTNFTPINRMWERVKRSHGDSETALGLDLLAMGEMVIKLTASGFIAAIADDPKRLRYSQIYRLVRADGLGEWSAAIDETLSGSPSKCLIEAAYTDQAELTKPFGSNSWQYDALSLLYDSLRIIGQTVEDKQKLEGRKWFSAFVRLRNKTKGHGAIQSDVWGKLYPYLQESISLVTENFSLFKRPWAYLYRKLSGAYRVTYWGESTSDAFENLKTAREIAWPNGVYVSFGPDSFARVELITSDVEARDIYFPNGGFNEKHFEILSYVTGDSHPDGDSTLYLTPPTALPDSETKGLGSLEVQEHCFGNLPLVPKDYVSRPVLEKEVYEALNNDRHPIVTLVGRGGIGKTWLALWVLHQMSQTDRFQAIIWFSARDVDLLVEGPKPVQPDVLTQDDIAQMFVKLLEPAEAKTKGFDRIQFLSNALTKSNIGPLLFVFDNFETVRSPVGIYSWLDSYVRSPNKILITTRHREFKADYPIEVYGMTESEFEELVEATATSLGIKHLLTDRYLRDLYSGRRSKKTSQVNVASSKMMAACAPTGERSLH